MIKNAPPHLRIKVIPNSAKTESMGFLSDGTEKIRIKGQPEDNKANEELLRFLGKREGGTWKILSGHTSRQKLVQKIGE